MASTVDLYVFPIIDLHPSQAKLKYADPSAIPSVTSLVPSRTVTFIASIYQKRIATMTIGGDNLEFLINKNVTLRVANNSITIITLKNRKGTRTHNINEQTSSN